MFFILLAKSHLGSYQCPNSLNYMWGAGFTLAVVMVFQVISGLFLAMQYGTEHAYQAVVYIMRDCFFGWNMYNMHSYGASFVFFFLYIHLFRGFYYGLFTFNPNVWLTGCIIFVYLMAVGFMGYVLAWGEMSYWGATVITNLLTPIPNFLEWACGTVGAVGVPTLKRFFVWHFLLGICIFIMMYIHFFYLHLYSSTHPYSHVSTNNRVSFFPFYLVKDGFGLMVMSVFLFIQLFWGVWTLTHPDNTFEASGMSTPLHIVPEWYFLLYYGILKSVPNKNTGFLVMIVSVIIPFALVETRRMISIMGSTMHFKNILLITFLYFLVIGGKLPSDVTVSYGRVMTINFLFVFYVYLAKKKK